jgi:A/G-specific adenine glycosylase
MDKRYFSDKVVEWYAVNKRDLPWRSTRDPYKIWLSEIILQQTRVIQGLPYYLKFVEKFPTVQALASASEQEVLRLWQGLGYYTRARNLHKCAKEVVTKYTGVFPDTFEELKKLPGIGDYTAAAIASIAYQEKVAVVDGNVFRVLARIFGIEKEINSPEGKKHFTQIANELITPKNPDIHNQAVMEFGALYCTPVGPVCEQCIFQTSCFASQKNLQAQLPVKIKPKAARARYFYYFVFQKGKSMLLKKRGEKDIWHGLYDFHLVEKTRAQNAMKVMAEDSLLKKFVSDAQVVSKKYKHVLSHQIIHATFVIVKGDASTREPENLKYYSTKKIAELPKPVLISRFLEDHQLI